MDRTAPLSRLAAAYGIATSVTGPDGEQHDVADATVVAVLGALGVPATTDEQVAQGLIACDAEEWRSLVPACTVVRQGVGGELALHVTDGDDASARVVFEDGDAELVLEQSENWVEPREMGSRRVGRATFVVPTGLPLGYHTVIGASAGTHAQAPLIVVPDRIEPPTGDEPLRALGVSTLSLRSRSSWGAGDLGDLVDVAWTAARDGGADLVVVDPLHPVDVRDSGTFLSARWVDPALVRVEDVRETAYLSSADRSLVEWSAEDVRDSSGEAGPVDVAAVRAAKRAAFEVVHQVLRSPARQARYDAFVEQGGPALENYATWCALVDTHEDLHLPPALASARAPGVEDATAHCADRVELHRWVQWIADEQRADAHRRAQEAGARCGLASAVALGPSLDGPDAWAWDHVVARGVRAGRAPSASHPRGEVRNEVAWDPRALARTAYAPMRDAVRDAARHASAVVIEDAGSLLRSWWVPGGARAAAGTYVQQDAEALLGIVCLEAVRAGIFVVADDSGITDEGDRRLLAERGLLGVDDLRRGPFGATRPGAVARATGRVDPPLSAWLAGEDIDLRADLGIEPGADEARRVRRAERDQVVARAVRAGITSADGSEREQVEGLHAWAARSEAAVVLVRLEDAVGDRRVPALPDAGDSYPSGRLPLADANGTLVCVEDLPTLARLRALLGSLDGPTTPAAAEN